MSSVLLIGIAGGSGSGKTTFSRELQARLGEENCAILAQDSYYIDQSDRFLGDGENVNFDHPESLDFALLARHLSALKHGSGVSVPVYDFPTHKRLAESVPFPPRRVILLDGTLILSQPEIRARLDESVFIEAPEDVRFDRRLKRDVAERGRHPDGVLKQFVRQVKPMHDLYVEPSKSHAHTLVPGTRDFGPILDGWLERIQARLLPANGAEVLLNNV